MLNKTKVKKVVEVIKTPLGVALLLVVLLALIVLTPKELLPDVLAVVRTLVGVLLIDTGEVLL
ncbi:MAG: hypothetical protein QXI16_02120 [Sulfolobaceae archaeon]